jgi:hypothetical protein
MPDSPGEVIHVGFTGTRHGMTAEQRAAVTAILGELTALGPVVGHHGDCIGSDAEFHDLCREREARVIVHPGPDTDSDHAGKAADERLEPLTHMKRNKQLVLATQVMIATPFEMTEQEFGGTWKTIGMARKAKRPLAIVLRDGAVTRENWTYMQPAADPP